MKSFKEMKSQINEKLSKSDDISTWISDFVHSDAPQFKGKSKEERIKMAKGAYYGAQNEAEIPLSDKEKNKMLSKKDKNTLGKIADLMSKQKKPTKEGYYKNIDTNRKEDERLAKQKKEKENKKPKDWAHALAAESASSKLLNKLKDIEHKKNWAKNLKVPDYSQTPKKEPIDLSKPIKEALGDHAGLTKAANNEKHGPDAKDFHTAAKHIKHGNVAALKKHLRGMDTDPRDHVLTKFVDKKHHKALGFQMNEASSHVYVSDTNAKKVLGKHDSLFKAKAHMDSLYKKNPKGKYAMHTGNLSNTLGIKEGNNDEVNVNHAANAVAKTFKGNVQTASRFLSHLKPGTKKTTTWGAVNKALVKQGVQTHHIAKVAGHLKDIKDKYRKEDVEEGKVYDPFTKKMVNTKPIKVKMGGGATRNGVPVETGPSKYKEKLKEEQLDELSKKTLGSYVKKASFNAAQAAYQAGGSGGNIPKLQPHMDKLNKRTAGVEKAVNKLAKEENLDEISRKTLANYTRKAAQDAANHMGHGQQAKAHSYELQTKGDFENSKKEHDKAKKHLAKAGQRIFQGIPAATKRLAKEEVDQIDEKFIHPDHQKELDDPKTPAARKAYLRKLINSPRDNDSKDHEAWREKRQVALKGRHYHEATDPAKAAEQSKKAQMVAKHATEREALAKKQQREKDSMKEETTMLSFEDFLKEADMKNAVKYAVGLAKKHAGNMTHAVKTIEKKRKGLSNHPDVVNALRTANEGWDKKKTETVKHPNQKVLDVDGDGKIEKDDFEKLRKGHRGKKDESHCNEGANKKMKGDDPCWDSHEMVGMKMKNGRKVPNCVPKNEEVESSDDVIFEKKSYKAFTSEMDNSRRYVHKGTRYGGAAQHDDDNEFDNDDYGDKEKYKQKLFGKPAKKEPAVKPVKRGRGRPMGSKSGARN